MGKGKSFFCDLQGKKVSVTHDDLSKHALFQHILSKTPFCLNNQTQT